MPNSFIAFPVPASSWLMDLPPAPAGIRLLDSADLHLTIAFLGSIAEERARASFECLTEDPSDRIFARLGAVVPLGNPRHPSALSALVEGRTEGGDPIRDAIGALRDTALVAAGLPPDTREPLPHITLARIGRKAIARAHALEWAARIDLTRIHVCLERIALYRTAREPGPRSFEILESVAAGRVSRDPDPCSPST